MANPYHHAVSSARKWSKPEHYEQDIAKVYMPLHQWMDASKAYHSDFRHRALRHHSEGIFFMESIYGPTQTLASGKKIPTRWIGEQHVTEDLGFIPNLSDWLKEIKPQAWMARSRKLSKELEEQGEPAGQDAQEVAPVTKSITVQF